MPGAWTVGNSRPDLRRVLYFTTGFSTAPPPQLQPAVGLPGNFFSHCEVNQTIVLSSHFSQQSKISDKLSSLYSSRKVWDTEIILKIYVASYKLSITWSSKFVEMSTFADADALMANIPRFVQITLVTTDHLLEQSREQRRGDLSTIWRHSLPPARLSFC